MITFFKENILFVVGSLLLSGIVASASLSQTTNSFDQGSISQAPAQIIPDTAQTPPATDAAPLPVPVETPAPSVINPVPAPTRPVIHAEGRERLHTRESDD